MKGGRHSEGKGVREGVTACGGRQGEGKKSKYRNLANSDGRQLRMHLH